MLKTIKISMTLLVLTLLILSGSTLSYAWGNSYQGHSGSGGYHGNRGSGYHGNRGYHGYGSFNSYFGPGFNYWPYSYYYPNYYDTGVLLSSPVVQTPEIIEQPSTFQITPSGADDAFTINIPNSAGGYTGVLLKRSGKGFIGPQGEFYPEFPKVSQLKVMYG